GFATPDCATVTVTDGQVTEVTGAFTADGHLDISTDPGGDVEITVNTDATPLARGNWSMHIAVPPGDYQVCFGDRADVGPATDPADGCTSVTVPVGQTVPVIGHYPS